MQVEETEEGFSTEDELVDANERDILSKIG